MADVILKGIAVSAGVAMGKAFLLDSEEISVPKRPVSESRVPLEIARFEEALIQTRAEILKIQRKISRELGEEHGDIFNAHLMVIEDRTLIDEVITRLKEEKVCVDYIFHEVLKKYITAISRVDDEYLRERTSDIQDIGRRILRTLLGEQKERLQHIKEEVVVVAYDLSPSETASMHKERVIGFATDVGGKTSHTAIMARALAIPAVVGLASATKQIASGDTIIIDGNKGLVIVNPDTAAIHIYEQDRKRLRRVERDLSKERDLACETPDGHSVELSANIQMHSEIPSVIAHGARGIGLYRTEYFYMNRKDLPTEEEHYEAYKFVAEQIAPYSVIIRTMDLGGDKFLSPLEIPREMNPFLGWRAIRFSLARPDIFKTQISAILRASVNGKLKVMYPMISGIEELRQANTILAEVKEGLRSKEIPFDEKIEVGAMIEIPSAALTCDILAKEVNFFSIGTNDLIQYALAVDRVNEKIAYLYDPAHPAVLRLIKNIIDTGHNAGIWVGMCGEMAGEPAFALLLLGLGLDEFSTSPVAVPAIKRIIRSVPFARAKEIAEKALTFSSGKDVEIFLKNKLEESVH
jgi:phosphotransferase system enzyme I (PtsI)